MAYRNKTSWNRVLLLGLLLASSAPTLRAQTTEEWLQQKKTQRKYLVQQIAALQVYLDYLKKGYKVVNQGLTTIHRLKNGEVNLHRDFFASLKGINPRLSSWAQVTDIAATEARLVGQFGQFYRQCRRDKHFSPAEGTYLLGVYTRFAAESARRLEELRLVLTAGQLELSDAQRLTRIERLHDATRQASAFLQPFRQDTRLLSRQRIREADHIMTLQTLYGLPR